MKLSAIVLTKNEEKMIKTCLESIRRLANEIIVVDDQSTDKTVEFARKYTNKVFIHKMNNFSSQREFGLNKTQGKWILYVDADERVAPELKKEIKNIINNGTMEQSNNAYYLPRKNIFLGREQGFDKVERLFKRKELLGWFGKVHESPKVQGEKGTLKNHLIHLTHRDLDSMTKKTLEWSKIEAQLRFEAGHPPVTWWRLLKALKLEFYHHFFQKRAWRYGLEGWLEGLFQIFSLFMTYVRLWELQKGESLEETYKKIDKEFLRKLNG